MIKLCGRFYSYFELKYKNHPTCITILLYTTFIMRYAIYTVTFPEAEQYIMYFSLFSTLQCISLNAQKVLFRFYSISSGFLNPSSTLSWWSFWFWLNWEQQLSFSLIIAGKMYVSLMHFLILNIAFFYQYTENVYFYLFSWFQMTKLGTLKWCMISWRKTGRLLSGLL